MIVELKDGAIVIENMTLDDVPEVMEIEHESFPLPWPSSAYRYELLENKLSHYLVSRLVGPLAGQEGALWAYLKHSLGEGKDSIVIGYGGFWLLYDEVHISTLAVKSEWRRLGIGELLLLAMLGRALELKAELATLEVRVSNVSAQNLYHKYQFQMVGLRRRYYSDNNEDAFIMTVENIRSMKYRRYLDERKADLLSRFSRLYHGKFVSV